LLFTILNSLEILLSLTRPHKYSQSKAIKAQTMNSFHRKIDDAVAQSDLPFVVAQVVDKKGKIKYNKRQITNIVLTAS
jgi:predicted component of type VI protein secretion system